MSDKLIIPIASLDRRLAYPHNKPHRARQFDGSVLLQTYSVPFFDASLNKFNGHTKKAQLVISNIRDTDQALQNYWWFSDISGSDYVFDLKPNSATSSYGDEPQELFLYNYSAALQIENNPANNVNNETMAYFTLNINGVFKNFELYEPSKPLLDSYSSSTITHDLSGLDQLLKLQ